MWWACPQMCFCTQNVWLLPATGKYRFQKRHTLFSSSYHLWKVCPSNLIFVWDFFRFCYYTYFVHFLLSVNSLFWTVNDYPTCTPEQVGLELDSGQFCLQGIWTCRCVFAGVVDSDCLAISGCRKMLQFLLAIFLVSLFLNQIVT